MMKYITKQLVTIITLIIVSAPSAVYANSTLPYYSNHFDDTSNPFKDAADAITLAKETNRQVLIKIGGNWCSWCKKMDAFLEQNPDVKNKLHQSFVLLKVNVSDSNENEKFMSSLPPVLGYPHMYVSDNDGKLLLSKDTAEFLEDGNYSRERFLTFIENWQVKS